MNICRATHLDAGNSRRSLVPSMEVTPSCAVRLGRTGKNPKDRDNPQLTRLPDLGHSWAVQRSLRCGSIGSLPMGLRYGLRPSERMRPSTDLHRVEKWPSPSSNDGLVSRNWLVAAKRS
jgi:hypothetical protein